MALVQTLDFVTPMTDDPYLYGEIASANALSDVYAMGGKPLTAMNICSFPKQGDPKDYRRILEGGLAKVEEAGAVLAGGQTVAGEELVFGLSVTGLVHPKRVWTLAGAKPGDALILTKPIGTGAIINAVKKGVGGNEAKAALAEACAAMRVLNRGAMEAAMPFEVHAATDITGFGLAGHAWNIARESRARIRLRYRDIPRYEASLRLIREGVKTSLTSPNRRNLEGRILFPDGMKPEEQELLFDPQTSGGLLLAVPAAKAEACRDAIRRSGAPCAAVVGAVEAGEPGLEIA